MLNPSAFQYCIVQYVHGLMVLSGGDFVEKNDQRYIIALYVIVLKQTACESHGFHIDYTFTFIYLAVEGNRMREFFSLHFLSFRLNKPFSLVNKRHILMIKLPSEGGGVNPPLNPLALIFTFSPLRSATDPNKTNQGDFTFSLPCYRIS